MLARGWQFSTRQARRDAGYFKVVSWLAWERRRAPDLSTPRLSRTFTPNVAAV